MRSFVWQHALPIDALHPLLCRIAHSTNKRVCACQCICVGVCLCVCISDQRAHPHNYCVETTHLSEIRSANAFWVVMACVSECMSVWVCLRYDTAVRLLGGSGCCSRGHCAICCWAYPHIDMQREWWIWSNYFSGYLGQWQNVTKIETTNNGIFDIRSSGIGNNQISKTLKNPALDKFWKDTHTHITHRTSRFFRGWESY